MASLRGSTTVWDGVDVANNAVSPPAYVPSSTVAVLISNDENEAHTFKIQVAAGTLNSFDSTDLSGDGGLVWHDYYEKDISAVVSLAVAGNAKVAIDLSPFAPSLVRLVCTAGNAAEVTATFTSAPN